jgi:hypothetical protein
MNELKQKRAKFEVFFYFFVKVYLSKMLKNRPETKDFKIKLFFV